VNKLIYSLAFFLFVSVTTLVGQTGVGNFISFDNKHLAFEGRIGFSDSCAAFYWTGTNVTINVKKAGDVKALLADSKDENYLYIIIDGDSAGATKLRIDHDKKLYTLAHFSDDAAHRVQLFKITNTDDHMIRFFGFETGDGSTVLASNKKSKRKIEFIGNSITCGHGVEVTDSSDSGAPMYFNNYKTYAAITARHFNAQYHCTAKSGIGIMVSWFPQIMPEIFDGLDPNDSTTNWNFATYQPDIVVVNLFQNDSWIVNQPDNEQFKARFGTTKPSEDAIVAAYAAFIRTVRMHYPKARIICCLGNMDATREGSKWPGYIDAAVASLKEKKVTTHFFPYKNTPGHPKVKEQQAMADDLIGFIESRYWKN
jgi:Carbohydrate esterase 2 N-terminal/GDSL-like Lipase/Acylhydrolase family